MNPYELGKCAVAVAEDVLPSAIATVESSAAKRLFDASTLGAAAPDIEKVAAQAGLNAVTSAEKLEGGVVNSVFRIHTTGDPFIARFSENSLPCYQKERWAMEQAAQNGVKTPRIFGLGEDRGMTYMLMEDLGGKTLSKLSGDRSEALEKLGQQVSLVNDIKVKGYGFFLDQSGPKPFFTQTWRPMKEGETSFIFDDDHLIKMGALSPGEQAQAKSFLEPMMDWKYPPRLCHGDINLGNAILQDNGKVALIDWTQTKGGAAPFFDLANLSMSIPSEFPAVLEGYGIGPGQYAAELPNYHRVALTDVLRAGSWAHRVNHKELPKFVADIRTTFETVFS